MSERSNAPPMQRRGGPRPPEQRLLRPPRRPSDETGKSCACEATAKTGPRHPPPPDPPPSFARGGTVKKTGKIKAHKGEVVIPIKLVKKLKKLMV